MGAFGSCVVCEHKDREQIEADARAVSERHAADLHGMPRSSLRNHRLRCAVPFGDRAANRVRAVARPVRTAPGVVYFIRSGDSGAIKIGYAGNLVERLKELQIGNPCELAVVLAIPGDHGIERRFHSMFARDRIRGEWFAMSERMAAVIGQLTEGVCERAMQATTEEAHGQETGATDA